MSLLSGRSLSRPLQCVRRGRVQLRSPSEVMMSLISPARLMYCIIASVTLPLPAKNQGRYKQQQLKPTVTVGLVSAIDAAQLHECERHVVPVCAHGVPGRQRLSLLDVLGRELLVGEKIFSKVVWRHKGEQVNVECQLFDERRRNVPLVVPGSLSDCLM